MTADLEPAIRAAANLSMATQVTGIHGDPDDELGVGLIAPQADVLDREIDGERLRHLVLHALEQRNLVAVPGGLFVDPVHVRR